MSPPSWFSGFMQGFGVAAFSPISLTPTVWLRSDLGIARTGLNVTAWSDQSGNGYNVTQSGPSSQPTYSLAGGVNGLPKLTFTAAAAQALLNASFVMGMVPAEIIAVATTTDSAPSANFVIVDLGNSSDYVGQSSGVLSSRFYNGTSLLGDSYVNGTPFIVDAANDGTPASFVAVDGLSTTGSVGTDGQLANILTVGNYNGGAVGGNGWGGDIYEVLVFDYILSAPQRAEIIAYLSARYSIAFTPAILTPTVWFRSDLGITTSGSNVSGWADQSGNGYNVSQISIPVQPAYSATGGPNNVPRVTFSGSPGQALRNAAFTFAPYPAEIFIVGTTTSSTPAAQQDLIDLGTNNDIVVQLVTTGQTYGYNGSGMFGPASPAANTPFVLDTINDGFTALPGGGGNGSAMALNGGPPLFGTVGVSAQGATTLTVGNRSDGSLPWDGDIYEILVFDYVLSDQARAALLNYLSVRYSIPV